MSSSSTFPAGRPAWLDRLGSRPQRRPAGGHQPIPATTSPVAASKRPRRRGWAGDSGAAAGQGRPPGACRGAGPRDARRLLRRARAATGQLVCRPGRPGRRCDRGPGTGHARTPVRRRPALGRADVSPVDGAGDRRACATDPSRWDARAGDSHDHLRALAPRRPAGLGGGTCRLRRIRPRAVRASRRRVRERDRYGRPGRRFRRPGRLRRAVRPSWRSGTAYGSAVDARRRTRQHPATHRCSRTSWTSRNASGPQNPSVSSASCARRTPKRRLPVG